MTGINPINVNASGVRGSAGFAAHQKMREEPTDIREGKPEVGRDRPQMNPDDVMNYLVKQGVSHNLKPTKSIDTSKYVDKASSQRIAEFMGKFEDRVAEGLKAFDADFGNINISDNAKMKVVLDAINKDS